MATPQLDIFNPKPSISAHWSDIEGLSYVPNFISSQEEKDLINHIDNEIWLTDLKRRVQHYGYKYDYKSRRIDTNMKIGELPNWLDPLIRKFQEAGFFTEKPDQVIINEYEAGQGITPHIDCEPCFEDTIISLSLLSAVVMDFTNDITNQKIPVLLAPKSIVVLKDESRYDWKHGIAPRQNDKFDTQLVKRSRRVSLTFRKVIL